MFPLEVVLRFERPKREGRHWIVQSHFGRAWWKRRAKRRSVRASGFRCIRCEAQAFRGRVEAGTASPQGPDHAVREGKAADRWNQSAIDPTDEDTQQAPLDPCPKDRPDRAPVLSGQTTQRCIQ